MPPLYFPLRWESTGDQWWYACPIDYAAANGHYESTRELLRLDANNLIKFTSLKRIRRLETVWDDNEQFHDVAKCRAQVAHKLYMECETKGINNSLVRAGYGGWLLYTAASAGDLEFVQQLLRKDPLLVFGEGEYGVTDILYAAATSKSCQVFKLLFDFAISPRFDEVKVEHVGEVPSVFKTEMINRAMQAAARGGNIQVLKYLLQNYCSDILDYRDVQGSTILHAAASKGQVQVVKELITCFDNIINATDNQGNTALHIAAYKGQLGVVESLVAASPSAILLKNNAGENFLHMAVSGYKTHAFRRMDQQTDFMKQLVSREIFNIKSIINDKNNCGRTVLHLAIIGNIHSDLVQLLMTVSSINVNVRDSNGMTPLDHLRQQPSSALSDRLTRDLVSAGGICGSAAKTHNMVSRLRAQSTTRSSPGTLFKISDAEILLNTGLDAAAAAASILKSDPGDEIVGCDILKEEVNPKDETCNSVLANRHSNGFKRILHWPKVNDKKLVKKSISTDMSSVTSTTVRESSPVPLRQRFSKASSSVSSPSNNKRPLSVRSDLPSPAAKKKLASAAGLKTGAVPLHFARRSRSSSFSQTSNSSPKTTDKQKCRYVEYEIGSASFANQLDDDDITPRLVHKQGSLKYLCFGAPSLCGKDPDSRHHVHARSRSEVSVT